MVCFRYIILNTPITVTNKRDIVLLLLLLLLLLLFLYHMVWQKQIPYNKTVILNTVYSARITFQFNYYLRFINVKV
jgi:hypothetical protein